MNKFMSFMENKFIPVATRISNNKVIQAVSRGSMSLMPIIIVGAIFSLLGSMNIASYQEFIKTIKLDVFLGFVPAVTINAIGLYMAFFVAYHAADVFDKKEMRTNVGILSVVSYLILTPLQSVMANGAFQPTINLDMKYLGSSGAFTAILTGLVVAKIYQVIIDKNLTIKMPASVPLQVSKSFTDIIPAFFIFVLFSLIRFVFSFTENGSVTDYIYHILQVPLQNLTGSLATFIIILLVAQLLWFFGIHGSYTVLPILMPIWIGYIESNIAANAAGQPIPHIWNFGMYDLLCIGGAGSTLGLVLVMTLTAKSDRFKKFSKLVTLPGIFNINEPLIFGMPIILNPIMLVPFIFTPLLILLIGYSLMVMGIVNTPIGLFLPGSTPVGFSGFLQGGWTLAAYQVFSVILSAFIYFPFFRVMDNTALREEKENSDEKVSGL